MSWWVDNTLLGGAGRRAWIEFFASLRVVETKMSAVAHVKVMKSFSYHLDSPVILKVPTTRARNPVGSELGDLPICMQCEAALSEGSTAFSPAPRTLFGEGRT